MWKVILGQWVPWSFPHTVPWFFKHLETSLECHTVGSSIFLEDRSRAASIMASFSSQPFRCSHSSCLPHFRTRINSSWWVLFRFKEGWKRCSNLGKWKCLSLVELFSSWFLTPNWKHAQSHTHSSVKGRRLSVHEVGWSYCAVLCEHLVYSDSWPQTPVFSPASVCMSMRTQSCPTLTLWTVGRQAPLSMGFSIQEYQSGLPFSPGDLPDPGIKPASLASPQPPEASSKCPSGVTPRSWHPNGDGSQSIPPH